MAISSDVSGLGWIVPIALDWIGGVHHDLPILYLDGEHVHRSWSRSADNFSYFIENRTVAWAVKPLLVFVPGHGTSQMRTSLPERYNATVLKSRDVEVPLLNVADCTGPEFIYLPGNYFRAKCPRFETWFEEVIQRNTCLAEESKQ
jgi:hypothetical protein